MARSCYDFRIRENFPPGMTENWEQLNGVPPSDRRGSRMILVGSSEPDKFRYFPKTPQIP